VAFLQWHWIQKATSGYFSARLQAAHNSTSSTRNHKLIPAKFGDDVIGHQDKHTGMDVDAEDNV
jgi:hypothetical protein